MQEFDKAMDENETPQKSEVEVEKKEETLKPEKLTAEEKKQLKKINDEISESLFYK